ncbi:MAG TPA: endonuclease/exonuclease/phosphatase family protein [Polyangiaceae bacterium LLY-WYZ-15_(1-7)]|nr:endonuclease/exonuclease/phosphatase family protein [Polyangiaceae bacterium LLY-WYZ-15_(1-7)]
MLRLITWNVNGLEERAIGRRMEKLCLEVLVGGDLRAALEGRATRPAPDLIAFQEMTRHTWAVMRGHLAAGGYRCWPEGPREREDWSMLAVRAPWSFEEVALRAFEESPLAREAVVATVAHPDGRVLRWMTAHLESLRSGGEARLAQAREIDGWLAEAGPPGIFAGDTNLRRGEWETLAAGGFRARDAFELAGRPAKARHTWVHEGSRRGFRFDRVWLGTGGRLMDFALRDAGWASDHRGVECAVEPP